MLQVKNCLTCYEVRMGHKEIKPDWKRRTKHYMSTTAINLWFHTFLISPSAKKESVQGIAQAAGIMKRKAMYDYYADKYKNLPLA